MKKNFLLFSTFASLVILATFFSFAQIDIQNTRLMTQPAIGKNHLAFIYANDLWIADVDGKNVKRLTIDEGIESNPFFSPDEKWIAFSAQYEGNTDVYLISTDGGVPKRLTYHPGSDIVRGFTPDGNSVLFISGRNVFTNRYTQFFTVSIKGGFEEQLKIPNGFSASYSPDGTQMAYTPIPPRFQQWKNYRGGTVSTIWITKFSDYSIEKIPQPEGRCNDIDPMWIGDKIYFRSDRNGEFNIYSFDIKSKDIKQLTEHNDFPVLSCSKGDGKIIYEQAGYLYTFDIQSSKSQKLTIGIATDLLSLRPRYTKGDNNVRSVSISPTGARAVFEFRGEVITVPAEKGDARNLTQTTGVHERSPIWSPDGLNIAYFSDESSEYELHVAKQDAKGEVKKFKINGNGYYDAPLWSPDNQKICFKDNSQSFFWIDLKTGVVKKIASEKLYSPVITLKGDWSPDSRWIVYTLNTTNYIQTVYVYFLEKDKSFEVTDGMSEVSEPVFDKSGKYLYFFGSTDAGPVKQWFDMSNADMRLSKSLYVAVLKKDLPSPLAKESDEEKGIEKKDQSDKKDLKDKKDTKEPAKKEDVVNIDFDGLNFRILSIPVPNGYYSNLQSGKDGEFYYIESPFSGDRKLHKYDLIKRKDDVIIEKINSYLISEDRNKILYSSGSSWAISSLAGKIESGKGILNIGAIEVKIEPVVEWKQIFNEVWRINRDYFYDPNMHGANWKAIKAKYEVFIPHLSCRNDLNRLIQWICSELVVGHSYSGGGEDYNKPKSVPGGLLGADYAIENGKYRFKKVYGGLNWNPELRSPLTEPGVNAKEGEYLLAVDGKEIQPPINIYSLFENTTGKIVELKIGPNPDGSNSRIVNVVPVSDESSMRNRDWVEGNIRKVNESTNGRVAYVYVPNTSTLGHTYFKRYFFPQADKEAIIVDERFNGGGSVADYYIDILRRPFISNWATRYGEDIKTPGASIQGPKVMIIDETAGSGGDLLPWMFRKFKLGTLVGKRTWGGLVGILGYPVLMDGGSVTAPNLAIWTEDGWVVENEGVPPDIEIEQLPSEIIKGHDPQLEKAIQVAMEELKKNPPEKMKRPPYPVKVRK